LIELLAPWAVKRFVDKEAEIIYVPFEQVIKKNPKRWMRIPFDLP